MMKSSEEAGSEAQVYARVLNLIILPLMCCPRKRRSAIVAAGGSHE